MMNLLKRYFALEDFSRVALRDRYSVVSALVACGLSLVILWSDEWTREFGRLHLSLLMFGGASGISLFLAARLWARNNRERELLSLGALAALAFFILWHWNRESTIINYRLAQWFVITHLLVALAPIRHAARSENFVQDSELWRFNWYVATRFVFGGFFCTVMAGGLIGALATVKVLFGTEVKGEWFATIGVFVLYVLSVFQVLSTIDNTKVGPQSDQVTRDLRRMIQYLYTPLSLVYFLIAYAYIIKVLLAQDWPRGYLGWLVSPLTVIVLMTYLLQRPLAQVETFPKWMVRFWNWSFVLLLAPLLTLALAIWRRVSEYGFTEERTILTVLCLWALAMCVYYMRPHKRSIAMIPVSLFFVGAATFVGPLSPAFISYHSQLKQLNKLIRKYGGVLEGTKMKWRERPPVEERDRIRSILKYHCDRVDAREFVKLAGLPWREGMSEQIQCYHIGHLYTDGASEYVSDSYGLVEDRDKGEGEAQGREYLDLSSNEQWQFVSQDFETATIYWYASGVDVFGKGRLQFRYKCCGTELLWEGEGKNQKIDFLPLLEKRKDHLDVRGAGGLLSIWPLEIHAIRKGGELEVQKTLKMSFIFRREGVAVEKVNAWRKN